MLPPGHAAAGYLVAFGILSAVSVGAGSDIRSLLWLGFMMGAILDLDMFAAFAKTRSLVIENQKKSHRTYVTHTPLFWIVIGLITFLITRNVPAALIVILAPLSHLFLDSIEDEISWLWPFSSKGFRIVQRKKDLDIPRQAFFSYWIQFLAWYWIDRRLTAVLECVFLGLLIAVLLS